MEHIDIAPERSSHHPLARVLGIISGGLLALYLVGRGIAAGLVVSGGAVEKHVASIFSKLGLPPDDTDNRRVLAVLHYLRSPA